jgi:hypothetical protein
LGFVDFISTLSTFTKSIVVHELGISRIPLAFKQKEDKSEKMLYVIGLGLSDEKDITVKGLEVRRSSQLLDMP